MKWRHPQKILPVTGNISHAFSRLIDEYTPKTFKNKARSYRIGQFRIPGHTGASGVKPTKVRLMRGRNESTRAFAMANHHCFAFNCIIKKQKKTFENIPGTGK